MLEDMRKLQLGRLTEVVIRYHREYFFQQEPNYREIRRTWRIYNEYPNVLKLIDYLKRENVDQLGSSSIDFNTSPRGEFNLKKAINQEVLYIGVPNLRITPLRWLWLLEKGFDEVPHYLVKKLDKIAESFLSIQDSPELPDNEI